MPGLILGQDPPALEDEFPGRLVRQAQAPGPKPEFEKTLAKRALAMSNLFV